jgi:hypothetical protein
MPPRTGLPGFRPAVHPTLDRTQPRRHFYDTTAANDVPTCLTVGNLAFIDEESIT